MLSKKTNLILLILLFTGFLFLYYPKILTSPNSYLFNGEADGFKNYYTYLYHVKHDSSYFQFGGMHYPYGENVVFTDGHALLAWAIKAISKIFPGVIDYSAGIINWMMIISLLFSAIFIYLILCEYGLDARYSAACAFAIAALSPQMMRYLAHYALSYSCVIPFTWYAILKYEKSSSKFLWAIVIAAFNTSLLFIHMYLGMLCIIFLLFYWVFFHVLRIGSGKSLRWKHFAYLLIQIAIPIIISQLYLLITDYHGHRPKHPLGFYDYHATWESIFLPYYCWFQPHIHETLGVKLLSAEGISYVGVGTIITLAACVLLIPILVVIKYVFKKSPSFTETISYSRFRPLLLTATITLLFSMAYPFRWNMDFILDWIPQLRQFRSLGRFAWIFYYVSTIYTAYLLNSFFIKRVKKNYVLIVIAYLFPALQFVEAIPYHKTISESIQNSDNLFNVKTPEGKKYSDEFTLRNSEKYQAIIALPFYHEGSENFMRLHTEKSFRLSQLLSYYSGLPMVNAGLGRTSIEEAKRIIQIVSPNFYHKPVKELMKNQKPFLIIYSKENLSFNENHLLKKGMLLKETEEYALYEISFENLFADEKEKTVTEYNTLKDSLQHKNGCWMTDTNAFVYYNDFESTSSPLAYNSKGAYSNIKNGYSVLIEIDTNTLSVGTEYIASFWYYNKGENKAHVFFTPEELNTKTGETNWNVGYDVRFSETIDGDWSLAEIRFTPAASYYSYKVLLHGQEEYTDTIYVDNFLIRPSKMNVYRKVNEQSIFKNNHLISTFRKK